MGPITIFDESALQALNMDEAMWFVDGDECDAVSPIELECLLRVRVRTERQASVLVPDDPSHGVHATSSCVSATSRAARSRAT